MPYRRRTLPCRLSFVPRGTLSGGLEGVEPFPLFSLLPAFALGCGDLVGGGLGPWVAGIQDCRDPAKYVFLRIEKSAGSLVYIGSR